jgi:hypothetical protein
MVEIGYVYRILVGKPEGMGQLEKTRRKWKHNAEYHDRNEWDAIVCHLTHIPFKSWIILTS